jgi:preprotein translocase subunit YajC
MPRFRVPEDRLEPPAAGFGSGCQEAAVFLTGGFPVFIGNAYAQGASGAPGMDMLGLLPLILMFVLLYFLLIRPQAKRAKEHRAMVQALQKGDEVVTGGGILGKITKVSENYLSVEIAPNIEVQVQRPTVQLVLPKGSIKSAASS